jgi:methane/ammonia monooxygenase subunit A
MVWLRRCTHYLFIVVVAVNSTLLTINAGDYIFYTDWAWTSFVVFSISQTLMLTVGACYYLTFTGVPGTATYYALIMTVYTWIAKGAWFALGYPYDFIVTPVWLPSAMLLDLAYWATKKNKHSLILFGGVLVGMSLPLFNMVNLITVADPLETAFKYPRPTLVSKAEMIPRMIMTTKNLMKMMNLKVPIQPFPAQTPSEKMIFMKRGRKRPHAR